MEQPVFSVSQVNAYIGQMFSKNEYLRRMSVKGEVGSCKYHSSGHLYFTIKDRMGQLSCVMFAGACRNLSFTLQEGANVIVRGSIQVYERDGKYQLYAEQIEKDGAGALFEQMERLKQRLSAEGLFAPERKKQLPRFCMRIGIVTAKTGAAIQDIMQIARRRNPYVELVLCPAAVQGIGAAESICAAIRRIDAQGLDVLIIGRGGGSIEDLMAFNEEAVVRAIAACHTPTISAVGHETDMTLSDFAADLRAPTPSAAAELAVFLLEAFLDELDTMDARLLQSMQHRILEARRRMELLQSKLMQVSPAQRIVERKRQLVLLMEQLRTRFERRLRAQKHRLELAAGRLHAASPAARLAGGYAYLSKDMHPVRSVLELKTEDTIQVTLKDGAIEAMVQSITYTNALFREDPNDR